MPERLGSGSITGDQPVTARQEQSRWMSFVEAITNVVVGYLLAVATQFTVLPLFGLAVSLGDNLLIGGIFTAVSLIRSFILRRFFEAVRAPTNR